MNEKNFSIAQTVRFAFYTVVENILFFLGLLSIIALALTVGFLLLTAIFYVLWWIQATIMCQGDASCVATYGSFDSIIAFFKSLKDMGPEAKEMITNFFNKSSFLSPAFLFASLTMCFIYRYLILGIVRITLDFYDHQSSSLNRLVGSSSLAFKACVAAILYNLLIFLGLLLLIIPGIIAAIRFGFYQQVLVDKNTGIIDSLKMSAHITKGATLKIFAVNILFALINMSAYFTFGLTYLITMPAVYLAQAYMYRKLLEQTSQQ